MLSSANLEHHVHPTKKSVATAKMAVALLVSRGSLFLPSRAPLIWLGAVPKHSQHPYNVAVGEHVGPLAEKSVIVGTRLQPDRAEDDHRGRNA